MSREKFSLADRLKSLGVKVGTADLPAPMPADRFEINSVVAGEFHPTPLGDVFVAEQAFPHDYLHGASSIGFSSPLSLISQWADDNRISELTINRFAFLDTETSGLSGGTGTYAFLVGVGRFAEEGFVLRQFFMRDPAEEPALLEALAQFLAPCEALVTFNGKAFDAPLLETRYSLHRIPPPFKGYSHLDLLPLARRLWRDRLPSRALKYLEENVLGMTRASEEVPGYEIPWLYFDYLRTGDARPLAGVFYHNAMDVVAMAALLSHMHGMLANPFDGNIQHGLDFIALGKLYEHLGHWDEAARLYERGLEADLTEADFGVAAKRLSILHKRRGDLDQAIRLWEAASKEGHLYAFIELAKYHEHKGHDANEALKWTKAALERVRETDLPKFMREYWLDELKHREARLLRRTNPDGVRGEKGKGKSSRSPRALR
jgi:hypothetical protein